MADFENNMTADNATSNDRVESRGMESSTADFQLSSSDWKSAMQQDRAQKESSTASVLDKTNFSLDGLDDKSSNSRGTAKENADPANKPNPAAEKDESHDPYSKPNAVPEKNGSQNPFSKPDPTKDGPQDLLYRPDPSGKLPSNVLPDMMYRPSKETKIPGGQAREQAPTVIPFSTRK